MLPANPTLLVMFGAARREIALFVHSTSIPVALLVHSTSRSRDTWGLVLWTSCWARRSVNRFQIVGSLVFSSSVFGPKQWLLILYTAIWMLITYCYKLIP
jgi:hypothetical protein